MCAAPCSLAGRGLDHLGARLPGGFPCPQSLHAAPDSSASISTGALWQIAYAPYVSDYSRYMPRDTGVRPAFWASYWGCTLGSFLPMVLGAMVGLAAPKGRLIAGLAVAHGEASRRWCSSCSRSASPPRAP